MRSLCDPPEIGGMNMSHKDVADMTWWQFVMFTADKKYLKNRNVVNSFAEARALLKARRRDGNKAR